MHFTPGLIARISSNIARSSSTVLSGQVITTPNDRRRSRRRASASPAEYSMGKLAAERMSPISRFTGELLPITKTELIRCSAAMNRIILTEKVRSASAPFPRGPNPGRIVRNRLLLPRLRGRRYLEQTMTGLRWRTNPSAAPARIQDMQLRFAKLVAGLAFTFCALASAQTQPATLHWQPWSDAAFKQAQTEHKFVLLDLEAVWCHWCHVMDDITYRDPIVIRLLNQRYILVKVDQDSRPDISNRYQDYGWPATVVFNGDGSEIVKRQGYIPPRPMASMLQAIIDDPSPGPSVEREKAVQF